ncbi:conserved Plasmodium protein, unknown function [Plasmodium gallinaceum]|uniref:Uncharacterized protein n=1 Tax=Plasmodium gallinaceum TaxID=5849 RepID=A0A1J1GS16_PLAGA|nr:conserved Plasmodium protein, unknown function [Plasmodium gallinaceum]CRG95070.1 conserved Plasmodium protein, unknown function [Plasmodium gallinaceum]
MCDFLGSKLTKLDIHEVKKELSKKRKHYDDYDVYVYYKSLLELEKSNKSKKKKIADEEEEFKPCNYISSIYKSKRLKKKTIYDYIDKNDSIYDDIVTNINFLEGKNYTDDITLTFFNESLSYTLLRNNNYIDGIPIGVKVKEKEHLKQSSFTNDDNKNVLCSFHSPSVSYSSSYSVSTSRLKLEENFTNDLNKKNKSIDKKNEKETYEIKEKLKYERDKNKYMIKEETKNIRKEMGPKLPQIFEAVRKSIGNETCNINKNYERYENAYVNILSHRNNMISIKMKEQKEFEKYIKEIYKPKNNFEGAFFDEYKNNAEKKKTKSYLLDTNFLENEKGNIMINDLNKHSNNYFSIEDEQILEKIHDYSYLDSYLEDDIDLKDKKLYEKYLRDMEKVKNKNNNIFELYDPFTQKQETYEYSNFYDSLYKSNIKNLDNNNINSEKVKDLYSHYYKLINLNKDEQINKDELINLYMPKKNWVHFSNYENENNSQNKIYDLKRKVNFNNDIKKKNRFIFFCKIKENNIKIKNIFNIKELEEFNELMKQLKIYDFDFYTKEIINEDLNTNFQIENYDFSKYIYEKLNISNVYNKNKDPKKTLPKIDFFFKIPQFVFETIFYS